MGSRSTTLRRPVVTVRIAIAATLLIAVAAVWRAQSSSQTQESLPQVRAFFTVDDGVTYFVDDAKNASPYLKDGRTAYLAHVFSFDGGKSTFVGYLERYTAAAKRAVGELNEKGGGDALTLMRVLAEGREVKAPKTGDAGWIPIVHPAAEAIILPKSAGGSTVAQEILP